MKPLIHFSDVLVVGGGAAGLYAAISAKGIHGINKVTLLTPDELGSGGCSKKTHGINAALNPEDSWENHARDTYEGGGGINNPSLVNILCKDIAARIAELESWGVRFSKEGDRYCVGTYGGSSFSRSIHWFDITGLEIVQELVKRVILAGCFVHEGRWVVKLITNNSRCVGVIAIDRSTQRIEEYRARSIVLATGGGACVYPISSISSDKMATGLMLGYREGAPLVDLEMVQFHPTGILIPGSLGNGSLLEEEMRAQGGELLNVLRTRYMYNYDSRGELATRDVVARSTYLEIVEQRGTKNNGVIFDISKIDKETLANRLPKTVKRLRSWGVDLMSVNEVEISPTAHFLMGGLVVDENCETKIKGLFACGEDAGGIHGANRLGGNGVAEALVFGHHCGMAAGIAATSSVDSLLRSPVSSSIMYYSIDEEKAKEIDDQIKEIMWNNVGVVRWQHKIKEAWENLCGLRDTLEPHKREFLVANQVYYDKKLYSGSILLNKLDLAIAITTSALARKHSLGAHYLSDGEKNGTPLYNVWTSLGKNGDPETNIVPLSQWHF